MSKLLDNRRPIFEYFFLLSSLCKKNTILLRFLLEYGMLGALLEVLLDKPGISVESIKKCKPILLNKELNLGFQNAEAESSNDPGKRFFAPTPARSKHYRFAIELLSLVAFSKQSSKAIPLHPQYELNEVEKDLVKFVSRFEGMQKLFVYGENSVARACVRDMVVHVCFGEKGNSKEFMENLMARLARISYKDFPLYVFVIESLIVLEDGLMEDRVLIFVAYFVELTKSHMNQSYIGFSYVTDLFIKLALKINTIHVRVQNEWSKFSHVEKWLKKREYPIPNAVFLCTNLDLLGCLLYTSDAADE
eukprot:TRINITY_DN5756_c0_g1_i6.p1 TRINITY_DN5756_c0_g1~~TRINITY_DN5756_c0_g1_i6.p1  ORF type:complete len:305 (-),score=61.55 TRINITY_DN5756_c0_g1_i6:50-964(-)